MVGEATQDKKPVTTDGPEISKKIISGGGDVKSGGPKRVNRNIIFVATVIALLGFTFLLTRKFSNTNRTACGKELITEAKQALEPGDGTNRSQRLATVAQKIEKVENYKTSSECVLPVVSYYIDRADEKRASEQLEILTELQQNGDNASTITYQITAADLRAQISRIEYTRKEFESNVIHLGEPVKAD